MKCFAYGSNLNPQEIKKTCPSYTFLCVAKLTCHKIAFTRRSQNRQCGVADIVYSENSEVLGVVYNIDNQGEIDELDKREGYKLKDPKNSAYRRVDITVYDVKNDAPMNVETYEVVKKEFDKYKPNPDYRDLIIAGAEHWKLPKDYIEKLKNIEVI